MNAPLGAKLVLGWLMLMLIVGVFSLFTRLTPATGDIIAFVIQIAVFTGLYTRQRAAWRVARWLSGLAIVVSVITLAIVIFASGTKPLYIVGAALNLGLASSLFYLLGRPDSRVYFHAPRKA